MRGGAGELTIHGLLVGGGEVGEVAVVEGIGHELTCVHKAKSVEVWTIGVLNTWCAQKLHVAPVTGEGGGEEGRRGGGCSHACCRGGWSARGPPGTTSKESSGGRTCDKDGGGWRVEGGEVLDWNGH